MSYPPCSSIHSYQTLAMEREGLVQKYLHLLQMVEVEKIVAKQLRQQVKDGEIDIQWLKAEVTAGKGCRGSWPGDPGPTINTSHPGLLQDQGGT